MFCARPEGPAKRVCVAVLILDQLIKFVIFNGANYVKQKSDIPSEVFERHRILIKIQLN